MIPRERAGNTICPSDRVLFVTRDILLWPSGVELQMWPVIKSLPCIHKALGWWPWLQRKRTVNYYLPPFAPCSAEEHKDKWLALYFLSQLSFIFLTNNGIYLLNSMSGCFSSYDFCSYNCWCADHFSYLTSKGFPRHCIWRIPPQILFVDFAFLRQGSQG